MDRRSTYSSREKPTCDIVVIKNQTRMSKRVIFSSDKLVHDIQKGDCGMIFNLCLPHGTFGGDFNIVQDKLGNLVAEGPV